MSEVKNYYYLKLKENFYDREEIKAIESMQSGFEYICIMQKMYLRSLKREGKLMLTDTVPYDIRMLSSVLGHKEETIKTAVEVFQKLGLCEVMEDSTIYMTEIQLFIGRSSTEADRKRNYRAKIDQHKHGQIEDKCPDKSPPKIETELKIEIEIEYNGQIVPIQVAIIQYLNDKTGRSYKPNTQSSNRHIFARIKEGRTFEDFKKVIDIKVSQWLKDPKMSEYLRPETLFGTKFDSYLNQLPKRKKDDHFNASGWEERNNKIINDLKKSVSGQEGLDF